MKWEQDLGNITSEQEHNKELFSNHELTSTFAYGNQNIIFVISNKSWYPGIQIIVSSAYVFNGEVAHLICICPELIVLKDYLVMLLVIS